MSYHHIVAAYDGSKASEEAIKHAIKLLERNPEGKLTVVHATYRPPLAVEGLVGYVPPDYREQLKEYDDAIVQKAKVLTAMLPHAEVVVTNGNPALSILEIAEKRSCDLIVMGSRGLGAIKELVLGSVSHHVVQHSRIPVLIVK